MLLYYFLIITYFLSVISISLASLFGLDIQNLLRVPGLNVRYIDIAIILIFLAGIKEVILSNKNQKNNYNFIALFIGLFIIFEITMFILTFGRIEFIAQVGFLLASFCVVIFYHYSKNIDVENSFKLFQNIAIGSAISLAVYNLGLIYALITGVGIEIQKTGGGERVLYLAKGMKETIGIMPLIPIVVFSTLNLEKLGIKSKIKKIIFIFSTFTILVYLVVSFHRGITFSVIFVLLYYLFIKKKNKYELFTKAVLFAILFLGVIYLFENTIKITGFNPIESVLHTIEYALDTDNPEWDKGRSISRALALQVWSNNFWIGIGFDYLDKYAVMTNLATAHNFFITSLVHKGVVGTLLYTIILLIVYYNVIRLFKDIDKVNDEKIIFLAHSVIISALLWFIPFWVQEVIFERYSLSFQFVILAMVLTIRKNILLSTETKNA